MRLWHALTALGCFLAALVFVFVDAWLLAGVAVTVCLVNAYYARVPD